MKGDKLGLKEIGEYYREEHALRPLNARVVEEYAESMLCGAKFPAIRLGIYTGMDGKPDKLIVDGVHTFRAAQLAKVKKLAFEVKTYESLAEALKDQLKMNARQGQRLTAEDRDARIRLPVNVYHYPARVVATVIALSLTSISKIARGKQNMSGTGKPGPKGPKVAVRATHTLTPKVFFRAIENVHISISKAQSKKAILLAMQDPIFLKEKPQVIILLRKVVGEFQQLLKAAIKLGDVTAEVVGKEDQAA